MKNSSNETAKNANIILYTGDITINVEDYGGAILDKRKSKNNHIIDEVQVKSPYICYRCPILFIGIYSSTTIS